MNKLLSVKFLLAIQLGCMNALEILPGVPNCRLNDTDLNGCLLNATEFVRPFLEKTFAALGIPTIDPLLIPMVKLEQSTDNVNYKAMLKNISLKGLLGYKFSDIDVDFKNLSLTGKVKFDSLNVEADYFVTGHLFKNSVNGMGILSAEFNETSCEFSFSGQTIEKNGSKRYANTNTLVNIMVSGSMIHFDSLFDEDISNNKTSDFIENNTEKILHEIKPAVESIVGMFLDDMVHKLTQNLVLDEVVVKQKSK